MRRKLLREIKPWVNKESLRIDTDEHARYAREIMSILPHADHCQFPSIRGALVGQGELKRTASDPLFSINHTLAMFRCNIKRLARRTWCTTKNKENLKDILDIYIHYHNTVLLSHPSKRQN